MSALDKNALVLGFIEPMDSDVFSYGSDSAYPPDRRRALFPTAATITYTNASLDDTAAKALRSFSDAVTAAADADGQDVSHAAVHPNYALFDTPLEDLYGANLPRLRAIKREVDPENVMSLTGGFKL
jgi:Berberine and berberine like